MLTVADVPRLSIFYIDSFGLFATFKSRRHDLANSATQAPLITNDDFRITTPYIVIRGCREVRNSFPPDVYVS